MNKVSGATHITLVALDGASLLGIGAIVEVFAAANEFAEHPHFQLEVVASEPVSVYGTESCRLAVTSPREPDSVSNFILLCGAYGEARKPSPSLVTWLRRARLHGSIVGGIGDAAAYLLEEGLLGADAAAIHGDLALGVKERTAKDLSAPKLYTFTKRTVSSMGGVAALDLGLYLVEQVLGNGIAALVSDRLVYGHLRGPAQDADQVFTYRIGLRSPVLAIAVQKMKETLDSPLEIEWLASAAGVSVRQLQRLFQFELSTSPTAFKKRLRLSEAERMLKGGGMKIGDIAIACGFASASAFSVEFKKRYGQSPRSFMRRRNQPLNTPVSDTHPLFRHVS